MTHREDAGTVVSVTVRTEILSYLQANKLDWHIFLDAGRRFSISGAKTKISITHSSVGSIRSLVVLIILPPNSYWADRAVRLEAAALRVSPVGCCCLYSGPMLELKNS